MTSPLRGQSRVVQVVVHEVRARYFEIDAERYAALFDEDPFIEADDELTAIIEHSDTWERMTEDEAPDWLVRCAPDDGWREVTEVERREVKADA